MADLKAYNAKRDFSRTPEPSSTKRAPRRGKPIFVVQKHDATRLHWDFRLEHDGVLKSWAVTNEPVADPAVKRLAVRTEDHPLAYASFEGSIPKGSYGAGDVEQWDTGTWTPLFDADHGFEKGHLEFELDGSRMKGRWHLVRMRHDREKHRPGTQPRENWLLIKGDDHEQARPSASRSASPRQSARQAKPPQTDEDANDDGEPDALPAFVPPALATSVPHCPTGSGWIHEVKFDGYRIQAAIADGKVALRTRKGLDWTSHFRRVAEALAGIGPGSFMIDGEVVVEDGEGRTSFAALQTALKDDDARGEFLFYAFDLLMLDGRDMRRLPLSERKQALKGLIPEDHPVLRLSRDFAEDGATLEHHACRLGLEGIVSKRVDAPYASGRSDDWLKCKCRGGQEFLVCGFTRRAAGRGPLGALIVATGEPGALAYAGRVGTGFDEAGTSELMERLQPLTVESPPFQPPPEERRRGVVWVRPELVVQVDFASWTANGLVRQGVYKGIREDKSGETVMRDATIKGKAPEREATSPPEEPAARRPLSPRARLKAASAARPDEPQPVVLTHPDRELWPIGAVTKQRLADYYAAMWPLISPHLLERPLALLRCPDGVEGQSFFQKHPWPETRGLSRTLADGDEVIVIDDLDDLLRLVQFSTLEIHPWGAPLADVERCDQLIFDLDPGDGVTWPMLVDAAASTRKALEADGLTSFVKLSGGKGIHVVAPLAEPAPWDVAKAYARQVAEALATSAPRQLTATMAKKARKGRIFVDYLRNGRGATAVAPYSTRARPSGGIAMPLGWDELSRIDRADHWRIAEADVAAILKRKDPWKGFRSTANRLLAQA